uniref:Uncharacterized protein n=2 Tax=Cajanus cajan TaxID=3821 RepID=A0A151TNY1_CAJCA|nr:hypothetical protein KK1_022394 [Cajanus cajan]
MRFKTPEEAIELIDAIAANDYDLPAERDSRQKRGILELGSQDALLAQNKLLCQHIEALTKQVARIPQQLQSTQHQVLSCDLCGLNHPHGQCIDTFPSHGEDVNYMGNQARQGGNYCGNYGKNWQSHPSTGWNQNDIAQSSRPLMQRPNWYDRQSKLEETLNQFMQVSISNHKNNEASIKNLEIQMGQLAKQLAKNSGGNFSANTHTNPKENCSAITTRGGKRVGVLEDEEEQQEKEVEMREGDGENNEKK